MTDNVLLVPLQVEAFVLNEQVCNTDERDDKGARIIPITQPNYTFLRLDNFLIQSDVLNHADLHNAAPASKNTRMYDLSTKLPRRNRFGVYLHWILPQTYRNGVVAADTVTKERHEKERVKAGLASGPTEVSPGNDDAGDSSTQDPVDKDTPQFPQPPTRWIIVRELDLDSVDETVRGYFQKYEAWVLESDYRWNLDDIPLDFDLHTDLSPFVVGEKGSDISIVEQAEVFLGRKVPLKDYTPAELAKYTDLSILSSGNLFFADFQLHNSNVFSILDNFVYYESTDPTYMADPKNRKYLDKATASYYLIGWHSSNITDPLWDASGAKHGEKLAGIFMDLKDTGISETNDFLQSADPARMCLHGAMYDVKWDVSTKPASQADKFSAILQDEQMPATAVGTSPMDALISYITARKGRESDEDIERLEEDLIAIESLLHTMDDGVEGQREAKDMVYNWNFSRGDGGRHYFVAGEDAKGKPTQPDEEAVKKLQELNQYQQLLDACGRSATQYRWDMFSWWWKYVTDVGNKLNSADANEKFKKQTSEVSKRLNQLLKHMKGLEKTIGDKVQEYSVTGTVLKGLKSSTLPFYFRARDPTMLLGGIKSGWPADFDDNVTTRLAVQCVTNITKAKPKELDDLTILIGSKFPSEKALVCVQSLLSEFWALAPGNTSNDAVPGTGKAFPQFHHQKGSKKPDGDGHRDQWGGRQPWFPLYAEWEAEYTHVPFEQWELGETTARLSAGKTVRYGIPPKDGRPLWDKMAEGSGGPKPSEDIQILSGRAVVLPQPSFSLAAKVRQLFLNTPPQVLDRETGLDATERQWILENINRLAFLSCPLDGFTSGLLTLSSGTHIKPENKFMSAEGGKDTSAIKAALYPAAGLDKDNVQLISGNSALTPYASTNDYSGPSSSYCPFKPVTHGQFRFTKFNVIDKFGQALTAIDPQPRPGPRMHPPLYPSISDFYEPQIVRVAGEDRANTVLPNPGTKCEFIQLPPQINQNSRLNADFVMRQSDAEKVTPPRVQDANKVPASYWRPANEWENPIWGWLVINFADQGIQIFLPDGTFYREVRVGGREGALAEPKWLPFAQDPNLPPNKNNLQLDELVKKMQEKSYLHGLWVMMSVAIQNLPPSPSTYAQFLGSIVGKPLALVNMGISLEVEGPALTNQSTKTNANTQDPERYLLSEDTHDKIPSYELQVKLGDKFREYDGLVGYFDTVAEPTEKDRGRELILDHVNTYFFSEYEDGPPAESNLHPADASNYPKFKPFWVAPFPQTDVNHDSYQPPYMTPEVYMDKKNRQMKVFGAILDPFTPLHALSSFLPAKSIKLPSWTWQDAMQNITAFFHAGPLTVAHGGDIGDYDKDKPLTTSTMKDMPAKNVAFPSLGAGDWNWLQPFMDPNSASELPVFNAFGIEKKGNILTPGFEKGPYTALEGFLQLRRPIMTKDPKDDEKQASAAVRL